MISPSHQRRQSGMSQSIWVVVEVKLDRNNLNFAIFSGFLIFFYQKSASYRNCFCYSYCTTAKLRASHLQKVPRLGGSDSVRSSISNLVNSRSSESVGTDGPETWISAGTV
jgi:hypothetical protein